MRGREIGHVILGERNQATHKGEPGGEMDI